VYIYGNVTRDCTPVRQFVRFGLVLGTAALAALASALTSACALPQAKAPAVDFLVTTADSAYWVTSDGKSLRMRGVPMMLARIDGRFKELYVADDDHSYRNAVFLGQRMYARDLVRGDSVQIFADTLAPRLAAEYAKSHPGERPLEPDEEVNQHPPSSVTAEIEILDVHGPFVSFEYRTDIDVNHGDRSIDAHRARRGVLDARTGAPVSLALLFGPAAADSAVADMRTQWTTTRDSLLALPDERAARAQRALESFAFDPASFTIVADAQKPSVIFAVPGETRGTSGGALELRARPIAAAPWWNAILDELPAGAESLLEWVHGSSTLFARASEDGTRSRLAVRDAMRRDWPVGVVSGVIQHVIWLDKSVDADARRALRKAFNEASGYSEETRVAALELFRRGRFGRTTS
jgi:hypothetical protein